VIFEYLLTKKVAYATFFILQGAFVLFFGDLRGLFVLFLLPFASESHVLDFFYAFLVDMSAS